MERLTERTAVGILVKENYEKKVLKTLYSCYGEKPNSHYTNCEEGYCAMEKLAAYEDLEEQGLLLRLLCGIGSDIYFIPSKVNFRLNLLSGLTEENRVFHQVVDRITFRKMDGIWNVTPTWSMELEEYYVMKTTELLGFYRKRKPKPS